VQDYTQVTPLSYRGVKAVDKEVDRALCVHPLNMESTVSI